MDKSKLFLSCLITVMLATAAPAAWVELTDLVPISSLPGGVLVVGDKEFSEFEVTGLAQGGPPQPGADTVFVQGGQDNATGNYGLRFRLAWDAGVDQQINAEIKFQVSILPDYEEWFINDATLFLAAAGATGTGVVNAFGNIYDADFLGNSLAALATSSTGAGFTHLIDHRQFCLQGNQVQVKDIWVYTSFTVQGGNAGTAGVHDIYELYGQIPEPATVLLLGLGALALLRKRRQ